MSLFILPRCCQEKEFLMTGIASSLGKSNFSMLIKVIAYFFHTFFTKVSRNSPLLLEIIFFPSKWSVTTSTGSQFLSPSEDSGKAFFPDRTLAIPFLASIIGRKIMKNDATLTHTVDIPTQTV